MSARDRAIARNLSWFAACGLMEPGGGLAGVGERILLPDGNEATEHIRAAFPARVERGDHWLLLHKRPDCAFQTALVHALAAAHAPDADYGQRARALLEYLFERSGSRNQSFSAYPRGVWRWADDRWNNDVYLDDNGWCAAISLWLADLRPDWDRAFGLAEAGRDAAHALYHALAASESRHGEFAYPPWLFWRGAADWPHYAAPAYLALACALLREERAEYRRLLASWGRFVARSRERTDTSECAYLLMAVAVGAAAGVEGARELADRAAAYLLARVVPATGNLPSEHARETPVGAHLVDLIYTYNWAVLGMQAYAALAADDAAAAFLDRAEALLLRIQDDTPAPHLDGCWRGLYDLDAARYGGGDRHEGGAGSIYSGWTNAPLNLFLQLRRKGESLLDLARNTGSKKKAFVRWTPP